MLVARAVEGRINHRKVGAFRRVGVDLRFADFLVKALEHFTADIGDFTRGDRFVEVHRPHAGEHIHLLNISIGFCRRLIGHLVAVGVIAFIAVVFRGVVARGDDNTGAAMERAHRVGKHRGGHQFRVQMHLHAVCRQYRRRRTREHVGFNPRIVSNGNRRVFKIRIKIIGKALCCLIDGIHIHTVCARADNAAQPRRAEFQIFIKTVENFVFIALYAFKLRQQIFVRRCFFAPKVIQSMNIIHRKTSHQIESFVDNNSILQNAV